MASCCLKVLVRLLDLLGDCEEPLVSAAKPKWQAMLAGDDVSVLSLVDPVGTSKWYDQDGG